jgi:hypothetical protein
MLMSESARAIDDLRHVAQLLEARHDDPAAARVAAGLRAYEADAGRTRLDAILRLTQCGGAGPWWLAEARRQRDAALRELYEAHFPDQAPEEAAKLITRLADRRRGVRTPPRGTHEELVDAALRSGAKFPKARRLASILCNSPPGMNYTE